MDIFFIFLIGLIIGSFLNVVIFRLDKKGGILMGRSECPKCLERLKWYDLLPVLSYVFLKGKCRSCKNKISKIYPLTEIVTAFSFSLFYLIYKPTIGITDFYFLLIITSFVVLVFFDYLYFLIPDKIVLPLIIIASLYNYFFRQPDFISLLLSALVMGGIFAIIHLSSRGEWMGFGDAKLMFLIGLVLGYPLGFLALILSVWTAALVGIVLMLLGRANRKTALPFGSFLAGISIIIIIFQNELQKITNQFF
ncbi:MAG: Type 4 prepilin-like protein leader peptide-processing enzyme [Candidatus Yanofskybacteria bacterium GW2011_GWA1_39_13]|uniref:Type 4 prepilin-like protein leader peptide-processing enzyme n=1 Tax=Yanofskybacteria sp. (strain GW2011_GWA1_39_13) TaxID=1619019 RepID=A0A0G0PWV6_YANXG|nr:MAG: Type 4 prepilin-like protein leader peptide-processing enzyme [Candidatus Yanofskybacteria bacterium GW2011_GWA1_39_13]